MKRVRISTTVDADRLEACRRLLKARNSQLVDRALSALIAELEAEHDLTALERALYDDDPDLAWQTPPVPDLPYNGRIPRAVTRLAAARRRR